MAARDPITTAAANSSGKGRNDNGGRLKTYKAGVDVSTPGLKGMPTPRNPYKG